MKATFALLTDIEVYNFVRKLAWDVHRKYGISLEVTRLPPHISLKQPFSLADLDLLERYMGELAQSIQPFEIRLPRLQVVKTSIEGSETGILWLDVQETGQLRGLHLRLNRELSERFEDTQAAFDGQDYHFHMTVAIGGQPWVVYQRMYEEISATEVNLSFVTRQLALFVYDDTASLAGGFMTYKISPLSERH